MADENGSSGRPRRRRRRGRGGRGSGGEAQRPAEGGRPADGKTPDGKTPGSKESGSKRPRRRRRGPKREDSRRQRKAPAPHKRADKRADKQTDARADEKPASERKPARLSDVDLGWDDEPVAQMPEHDPRNNARKRRPSVEDSIQWGDDSSAPEPINELASNLPKRGRR